MVMFLLRAMWGLHPHLATEGADANGIVIRP
jgi:hypothetical protein